MTNFVDNVLRPERDNFLVRSLLDVDFYKFTMLYFIWTYYRNVRVEFGHINRTRHIPLARIIDEGELRRALDHVRSLSFTLSEITYISTLQRYGYTQFSPEFLDWLKELRLPVYSLERVGDQYSLTFDADWPTVTLWETIALATVNELYYRALERKMSKHELAVVYARATNKLWQNLQLLKSRPNLRFSEFGSRRRHNLLWQRFVLEMCQEVLGSQLIGTSNTYFAHLLGLKPVGTIAHEPSMVVTAIADTEEDMRFAQYKILQQWDELYEGKHRMILPDTYGTQQFLDNAPEFVLDWPGMRQDSGIPKHIASMKIDYWKRHGVSPLERMVMFSDGLKASTMVDLHDWSDGRVQDGYGQGTEITNGFRDTHPYPEREVPGLPGLTWGSVYKPVSIVCKVTRANGRPAVKLSDNPKKATGPKDEVARYLRIFGGEGRESVPVEV